MAAQDINNTRPDIFEIYIGGTIAPFHMTVSKSESLDMVPITTQRYGTTPIGHLIQGHKADLVFEFQEWTIEDLKRWDSIVAETATVNKLPGVGTLAPTNTVRLHNAGDGDDTSKDLYFPKVTFMGTAFNADGQNEARQSVRGVAVRDLSSGDLVQIGWEDSEE